MLLEAILLSVIAASTPLLLAASGELVVERLGVLNLGVEGDDDRRRGLRLRRRLHVGFDRSRGALRYLGRRGAGRDLRHPHARTRSQSSGDRPGAHHPRRRAIGPDRQGFCRREDRAGAASPFAVPDRSACRRPHPVRRGPLRLCLDRADHRHLAVPVPHAPASFCAPSATTMCRRTRLGYPVLKIRMLAAVLATRCAGLGGRLPAARLYASFSSPA